MAFNLSNLDPSASVRSCYAEEHQNEINADVCHAFEQASAGSYVKVALPVISYAVHFKRTWTIACEKFGENQGAMVQLKVDKSATPVIHMLNTNVTTDLFAAWRFSEQQTDELLSPDPNMGQRIITQFIRPLLTAESTRPLLSRHFADTVGKLEQRRGTRGHTELDKSDKDGGFSNAVNFKISNIFGVDVVGVKLFQNGVMQISGVTALEYVLELAKQVCRMVIAIIQSEESFVYHVSRELDNGGVDKRVQIQHVMPVLASTSFHIVNVATNKKLYVDTVRVLNAEYQNSVIDKSHYGDLQILESKDSLEISHKCKPGVANIRTSGCVVVSKWTDPDVFFGLCEQVTKLVNAYPAFLSPLPPCPIPPASVELVGNQPSHVRESSQASPDILTIQEMKDSFKAECGELTKEYELHCKRLDILDSMLKKSRQWQARQAAAVEERQMTDVGAVGLCEELYEMTCDDNSRTT
jgi:hypothetical protein